MAEKTGTVKVNVPGTPKGAEVEIPGLGLFKNGSSRKVNEQEIAQFEALGYEFPKNGTLEVPLKTTKRDEKVISEAPEPAEQVEE